MVGFLIEFRLHGYAKGYARELIYAVARRFRVRGMTRSRAVPHVTLYGPSETADIKRVISEVEKVGQKYTLVPFQVKGFGYTPSDKNKKVVYLDITPSSELKELRWELARRLSKISTHQRWDAKGKFLFHSTIAFKDIDRKFNEIWTFIKAREKPNIDQYLLRITIIGAHRKILYEYDLALKRLLNRREALSKTWWRKTINKLRELQGLPPEKQQSALIRFTRFIKRFG